MLIDFHKLVLGLSKVYSHTLRVRYCDTDQMGLVYHARYLDYFEWARTEFIRSKGESYNSIEKSGYFLPCSDLQIKFHKPAKYDDELTVYVHTKEQKGLRLIFAYEIFRNEERLISGESTHVFTNSDLKPSRPPKRLNLSS